MISSTVQLNINNPDEASLGLCPESPVGSENTEELIIGAMMWLGDQHRVPRNTATTERSVLGN